MTEIMEEDEVKLFGDWSSPFVARVDMALKLKGIRYEYIQEDLYNKSPLLLKYNPVYKKVPVLLHNGKPIPESILILEYIEDTWKANPILPEDPYDRAMARFWAKFIDETGFAVWEVFVTVGEEQEKSKKEASEKLKILEEELKNKKFFGGNRIGMVDIVGSGIAYWTKAMEEVSGIEFLPEEKYPKLRKWAEEFVGCSTIKECLPPKDKLIARFRAILSSTVRPK